MRSGLAICAQYTRKSKVGPDPKLLHPTNLAAVLDAIGCEIEGCEGDAKCDERDEPAVFADECDRTEAEDGDDGRIA